MNYRLKFLAFFFGALLSLPMARSEFLNLDPAATLDFEDLAEGSSLSDFGWTGRDARLFLALPPAGSGNPGKLAGTVDTSESAGAISSALTPAFTGDRLYFSAWLLRPHSRASGVRFQVSSDGTLAGASAGFGLLNNNGDGIDGYSFIFWGNDSTPGEEAAMKWIKSSVRPKVGIWYELVLVVDFNSETPSDSLGYLYYRILGEQEEYTVIPEFDGRQMSWLSSDLSPKDFTKWRVINASGGVQFSHLSAGMVRSGAAD